MTIQHVTQTLRPSRLPACLDFYRLLGFALVKPRREHWGSPRAYVHDPAGNLVELMASAPPPALSGEPGGPSTSRGGRHNTRG